VSFSYLFVAPVTTSNPFGYVDDQQRHAEMLSHEAIEVTGN
jgi:hypothetical protein